MRRFTLSALPVLMIASGGVASSQYDIKFTPTGNNVSCHTRFTGISGGNEENYLSLFIPLKEVEARLQVHNLQTQVKSEYECQRTRVHLVEAGEVSLVVTRDTQWRERTDSERRCKFVGGGGHDGGRYICHNVSVPRVYLEESLEAELLGLKFASFQAVRQ